MKRIDKFSVLIALVLSLSSCLPTLPDQTVIESPVSAPTVRSESVIEAIASQTETPSPTSSLPAALTTTPTFTPIPTFTLTSSPTIAVTDSLKSTGDSISLDKLPANTIYGTIVINNNAGTEVDISMHCTTLHGMQTVLEYNHFKHITIQAPQGNYIYVVYIGSKMLSGGFSFLTQQKRSLTIYKDRIVIQ